MSRTVNIYRTYSFRDKDPMIDQIRTVMSKSRTTYDEAAEASGVSRTTIRNWFEGVTKRPQFASMNAVAVALGCELRLVQTRASVKVNGRRRRKATRQATYAVQPSA